MAKSETNYSEWTLEELEKENQRLWAVREAVKVQQMELAPYLDAAWKDRNAEDAAKADPNLTQGIS